MNVVSAGKCLASDDSKETLSKATKGENACMCCFPLLHNIVGENDRLMLKVGGGLIGYVKSKPLRNGQIISLDVLVVMMIIAVFHEKLI